jgi:hypothetical protein
MSTSVTLPAGRYLICDLCYLDQEDTDELFANYQPNMVRTLYDGRKYAYLNTAHGDGSYLDQDGRVYGVDSGTIGVIQYEGPDVAGWTGHTHDFLEPFEVYSEGGLLVFGRVRIQTGSLEDMIREEEE